MNVIQIMKIVMSVIQTIVSQEHVRLVMHPHIMTIMEIVSIVTLGLILGVIL